MSVESQSGLFLDQALDLIGCTTILGGSYGVAFALYCLCARPLYLQLQEPDKRQRAGFTLGFISFLFICMTGVLALNSRVIQLAYINNADFPGGPVNYERSYHSSLDFYDISAGILNLIIEVSIMAIQVSRWPNVLGRLTHRFNRSGACGSYVVVQNTLL